MCEYVHCKVFLLPATVGEFQSNLILNLFPVFSVGESCTRHDGQPGVCMEASKCAKWMQEKQIRPNQLVRCSFVDAEVVFCCQSDQPTRVSLSPPTTNSNVDCEGALLTPDILEQCLSQYTGTSKMTAEATTPTSHTVGARAKAACKQILTKKPLPLDFQIYGGVDVGLGEYPHMAALGYVSEEVGRQYEWRCGGSLLTSRHILTAAHCKTATDPLVF